MTDIAIRDSDYLDKDALRAALPMEFVLAWYGRALNSEGKTLCPFHDDHNPSLTLWTADDGLTRWSCWACSPQRHGDVFDFIQDMDAVGFGGALNKAREILDHLPGDWKPTIAPSVYTEVGPDLEVYVAEARRRAIGDGWLSIATGLVNPKTDADVVDAQRLDRYLIEQWLWGVGAEGEIVMPHYDITGKLTGAKKRRPNGRRASVPGSRYLDALYGAWRKRTTKDVLLTEGETDNVWADYEAHLKGVPIQVYGLPSGAGAAPNSNWTLVLKNTGTIYLCFDPDDAGNHAVEMWLDHLIDGEGHKDVRVCRLPLGLDLRETRPDLAQLLAGAIRPNRQQRVGEVDEPPGYARQRKGGEWQLIAPWRIVPRATLKSGDPDVALPPAIKGAILANKRVLETDTISADDLSSKRALLEWTKDEMLPFDGADADVIALRSHLFDRASYLPEIIQTGRCGVHEPPARYSYLGRTLVYPDGYLGQLPWEVVQAKRVASLEGKTTFTDGTADLAWIYHFLMMNEQKITQPFLAWLVAATRRNEVRDFPLIFLGGSSGAGKSTLAWIGAALFGSRAGIQLGQATGFVLMSHLASTTTIPIFVDEWTLKSREDAREALQGSIPAIYEGSTAYRGTADQTLVPYRLTSPILLAGEDAFQMERELERTIVLNMNQAQQNYPALQALTGQPLGAFATRFYTWLVAQPVESLPPFPLDAPTRPEYNRRVLETGWATLHQFLNDAALIDPIPVLPPTLELSALDESLADRQDSYLEALRQGLNQQDPSRNPLVWGVEQGTWVRFQELIKSLQRNADIQLPGGSRAMKRHFQTQGYTLTSDKTEPPMSDRMVRATLIHGLHLDREETPE